MSVIRFAKPGSTSASAWVLHLLERKPRKLVAVALANKMARIIWATMARGEAYRRPPVAACRAPVPRVQGQAEMAIGRTDERRNPMMPMAAPCRAVVWISLADPIWASGHRSRIKGRTRDRFRTNASFSPNLLEPCGSFSNRISPVNSHLS
jgi:hypothetical protein